MPTIARPVSDFHSSPVASLASIQGTESGKGFALPSAFPLMSKTVSSESLQISSQSPKTLSNQEQFLFKRIHDLIEESTASEHSLPCSKQASSTSLLGVSPVALESFAQYLNQRLSKSDSA